MRPRITARQGFHAVLAFHVALLAIAFGLAIAGVGQ